MAISSVLSKMFGSQGDDVGRAVARTALKDYADTSKLVKSIDNAAQNRRSQFLEALDSIQPKQTDRLSEFVTGVRNGDYDNLISKIGNPKTQSEISKKGGLKLASVSNIADNMGNASNYRQNNQLKQRYKVYANNAKNSPANKEYGSLRGQLLDNETQLDNLYDRKYLDQMDIHQQVVDEARANLAKQYGEPVFTSDFGSMYFNDGNGGQIRLSDHQIPQNSSRDYYHDLYGDKYSREIVIPSFDNRFNLQQYSDILSPQTIQRVEQFNQPYVDEAGRLSDNISDINRQLQDRFNNQSPVMTYQQYIDSYR